MGLMAKNFPVFWGGAFLTRDELIRLQAAEIENRKRGHHDTIRTDRKDPQNKAGDQNGRTDP